MNYDQAHSSDVGRLFDMNTRDHHMKSLGHSPSPIGLFFSILNQFTSTASFVSGGKLITIRTDNFYLEGHDIKSRIFCGIANWLGHIMSDIAGSSITRRQSGDGMGIAIPFFELFQFCKFGKFNIGLQARIRCPIRVGAGGSSRYNRLDHQARLGATKAFPIRGPDEGMYSKAVQ